MRELDEAERIFLLRLARAAIEDDLAGRPAPETRLERADLTPALEETRGAFVTLLEKARLDETGHPRLRGCIGTIEPREPLYRSVAHSAVQAAREDPRFPAVTAPELPGLKLEISALTPLLPVHGPDAIVPGRDGVALEKGSHHAVFLPQVATEQRWGTLELLEHLARKAGLPADGWRQGKLLTFRAQVFGEAERP